MHRILIIFLVMVSGCAHARLVMKDCGTVMKSCDPLSKECEAKQNDQMEWVCTKP